MSARSTPNRNVNKPLALTYKTDELIPEQKKSENPEIQFLMDAFAKQQAEIKQLKANDSKKDEIIAKQKADIAFLQRGLLDTRNKLSKVRNATSGMYELNLGMFKRLLSRANGTPENKFNILQWLEYSEVWCVECLEKFKVSSCKNYTGSTPTCPICLPSVKLEKLQIVSANLQAFAGSYGKPQYSDRTTDAYDD